MNAKQLSEQINIPDVETRTREKWERDIRRRRRIEVWLVRLMPYLIILMGVVFYSLSAPHTANILNMITPGWGNFSPIGWEFGILIISALQEAGVRKLITFMILWGLVIMSIAINVAGGFMAVVQNGSHFLGEEINVAAMTFNQLFDRFGSLPASFQSALFLVIPLGILIPLIAAAIGEIVIKLAMGKIRLERQSDEQRWYIEAAGIMYNALFATALQIGATPKLASGWAQGIVDQMYAYTPPQPQLTDARGQQRTDGHLSARIGQATAIIDNERRPIGFVPPQTGVGQSGRTDGQPDARGQHGHGVGYTRKPTATEIVRGHLEQYPEDVNMTARDLANKLGVGKTTTADVLKELRND